MFVEFGGGRRCAELLDADARAVQSDVAVPALGRGRFDGYAGPHGRREDRVTVCGLLIVEPLLGGHGHDAGGHAVGGKPLRRIDCDCDLGAGSEDDRVGLSAVEVRLPYDVTATGGVVS